MQTQQQLDNVPAQPLGYSVPEAANALGLSPSGLWKWIALGKIRSVKIGNRRVISARELQRLLTEGI
jgi:excisionase family DNA binding protein